MAARFSRKVKAESWKAVIMPMHRLTGTRYNSYKNKTVTHKDTLCTYLPVTLTTNTDLLKLVSPLKLSLLSYDVVSIIY